MFHLHIKTKKNNTSLFNYLENRNGGGKIYLKIFTIILQKNFKLLEIYSKYKIFERFSKFMKQIIN